MLGCRVVKNEKIIILFNWSEGCRFLGADFGPYPREDHHLGNFGSVLESSAFSFFEIDFPFLQTGTLMTDYMPDPLQKNVSCY